MNRKKTGKKMVMQAESGSYAITGARLKTKKARKTEVIGIRLTERQRFEMDLISRILPGSPTLTGIVEWAIQRACESTPELENISRVWSEHEADRFVKVAGYYPATLTEEDQLLFAFIQARPEFRKTAASFPDAGVSPQAYNWQLLRDSWDLLTATRDGAPWDEAAFKTICKAHGVDVAKETK